MRLPWVLVSAILAGCATYQPKPIDPAQLARRYEARSLTGAELRGYLERQLGHPLAQWPPRWNREMLTLAADYYSPALSVARAQGATAKAGIAAAAARPNPVLQFPFEYITNHQGSGRPYTTGPALDLPFETAGKRADRIEQATFLSEAARLNALGEAWKVRSRVRDALLGIFAATRRIALLQRKAALHEQILDMLRRRESAGAAAAPEVSRALLLLTWTQADLAAAQQGLLDARARLAAAIGLPAAALDAVQFDFTEFGQAGSAPPAAAARRAAIFGRADLRAALAEYEASQAALQLEIAKQYPDIHIGIGYTYDAGANKLNLGLAGVTLPLLNRNRGAIAQAQARRAEMAARTEALQAGILNAVEHALARYRASLDALRLAQAERATAKKQMDGRAAAYAAGAVDRLAMTQAEADYQAGAIAYLNAAVAVQQAAGLLEAAMQRPLPAGAAPDVAPDAASLFTPLQENFR